MPNNLMAFDFTAYPKLFVCVVWLFLGSWCFTNPVFANEIIVDHQESGQGPQIISDDFLSRIDIAKPLEGISYNRFEQYDVGPQGIIINNSATGSYVEHMGIVTDNKNLAQPAKVIIFEVTGEKRTELLGPMKIVGNQAQFILVNPHGITCNGCRIINASEIEIRTDKLQPISGFKQYAWEKDLAGDIHIDKKGLLIKDSHLTLSAGKIKIEGEIAGAERVRVEAHADGNKEGASAKENVLEVSTIALITAERTYLIATGTEANIKVSSPRQFTAEGTTPRTINSNENKVYVETKEGDITISGIPIENNLMFKFVGRNLHNQDLVKAKNLELDLVGEFINHGEIQITDDWYSKSKSFINYGKLHVANNFQATGEYLVNHDGGQITAKAIKACLTGKRADGNGLYQSGNSLLEAGEGGMELIAPEGGIYFGYKKELTGAGDNKDGFIFIGSQLSSHGGIIHIQAGGDVVFEGTQVRGRVIVEAKGAIKEIDPAGVYRNGIHDVVKKVDKVRTVMKGVTKDRQVFDHWKEWCPSGVSIFGGCIGGPKQEAIYRTESYVEQVSTEEHYEEEVTVKEDYFEHVTLETKFSGGKEFLANKGDIAFSIRLPSVSAVSGIKYLNFGPPIKDRKYFCELCREDCPYTYCLYREEEYYYRYEL